MFHLFIRKISNQKKKKKKKERKRKERRKKKKMGELGGKRIEGEKVKEEERIKQTKQT